MKPTPEQVEAAKAVKAIGVGTECAKQRQTIQSFMADRDLSYDDRVLRILLAALEAAEQDSARLDWLEKGGALPSFVKGIWYGRGAQGYTEHDNLRAAIDVTKEAQP